jgi:DNA polymerase III subunit alpha
MIDFCHLHCHTSRSFFDGLTPVEDLVERCAELEQPGMAITDHGNVFAAAQFFKACGKQGVKGMIGMEAYEAVPHAWDREEHKEIYKRRFGEGPRYFHLTMWVQDLQGWENLCALHTISYTHNFKPRNQPLIDRATLERHSEGIMIGLGCMASRTNQVLKHDGVDAAYEAAKWYPEVFGDRVYMELMGNLPEQQALLRDQRKLATRLGVERVATNDIHYRDREDGVEHGAHHVLVQARAFKRKRGAERSEDKSDAGYGRWYGTDEFYMKSGQDMLATGGLQKDEIAQTVEVLDRTSFDFSQLHQPAPPIAPIPETGADPEFDAFCATTSALVT